MFKDREGMGSILVVSKEKNPFLSKRLIFQHLPDNPAPVLFVEKNLYNEKISGDFDITLGARISA